MIDAPYLIVRVPGLMERSGSSNRRASLVGGSIIEAYATEAEADKRCAELQAHETRFHFYPCHVYGETVTTLRPARVVKPKLPANVVRLKPRLTIKDGKL